MRPGLHHLGQSGATSGQVPVWNATTGEWEPGTLVDPSLVLYDAKGDLLVGTANDARARLAVGSDGQVLTADSTQTAGVKWATPTSGGLSDPTTTKGDVLARSSSAVSRLGVGSDGQVLTADSTQTLGVKWAAAASGSVATDAIFDAKGDLPVGTGADTAAKLTVGTNGYVLTADSTQTTGVKWAAASSGSVWDHSLTLPLTTLTDWTAGAGTWSASGTGIRQAATTTTIKRLWYVPVIRQAECVVQVEVNIATSGVGTRAGLTVGAPRADNNGGSGVWLRQSTATAQTDKVDFEKDGITYSGALTLAAAIANNTWITLRVHKVGAHVEAYVNGTFVGGAACAVDTLFTTIHLHSNGTDATFRNLDIWSPALP